VSRSVLVLGGAGFIGSRIAMAFEAKAYKVTVFDGFLPGTGARKENLSPLQRSAIIQSRIEDDPSLSEFLVEQTMIIDAMGWTCHRLALQNPNYDLELNLQSHIHLLNQLPRKWVGRIIYLGSRGQYGNPEAIHEIIEETPQQPEDVQGIHKVAAESHFRLNARIRGLSVASLRMPAVVGPHQPTAGEDIGLFGGFARDLCAGRTVDLYGEHRRRAIIHVDDVAAIVTRLAEIDWRGFQPFNVSGHDLLLSDALRVLQTLAGKGEIRIQSAPEEIAAIDIGAAPVSEDRLTKLLGSLPRKSVENTLQAAVEPFRS
jgi:nucleoside-diphosphate-sugar epimerase